MKRFVLDSTAPPERLAVLRILVASFTLIYLAVRAPVFLALRHAGAGRFDPVGVLAPLDSPLSSSMVVGCYTLALGAGLGVATGWWFRVSGPLFAVTVLILTTYRSSFGQILWLENLMVLHLLIVGFAPSADALTVARRRTTPPAAPVYGLAVQLAALVTVATYVVAGVAKLRIGGIDWITSDTLRNHVAATALRADLLGSASSPFGREVVRYGWLFPPVAALSVVLELGAPLALVTRRLRDCWVALTWLMHGAIAAFMFVVFPYPLFLVAFAPLYDLERLPPLLHRR